MSKGVGHFYEFDGFRFYPAERLLVRLRDGHPFRLMPKVSGLLLALVERQGETATYDEIKREVWAESEQVLTHTIRETKRALSQALGNSSHRLETVTGRGYRLNVEVLELANGSDAGQPDDAVGDSGAKADEDTNHAESHAPSAPQPLARAQSATPFAGHLWHAQVSCALYALLYTLALFVETAYGFDLLGASALRLSPLVFVWVYATSTLGLAAASSWARRENAKGLIFTVIIFTASGLLLYAALGFYLPDVPVTEANFQTYTAHGAYLKSVGYFLFLAVVFIIIPFHFVLSLQREIRAGNREIVLDVLAGGRRVAVPEGAIYLRVWWLGLFLFVAAVLSPIVVAHLFENLKPNPRLNLFTQLVAWRILIYLALGLECLLWYHQRLNEIRRECSESRHTPGWLPKAS